MLHDDALSHAARPKGNCLRTFDQAEQGVRRVAADKPQQVRNFQASGHMGSILQEPISLFEITQTYLSAPGIMFLFVDGCKIILPVWFAL